MIAAADRWRSSAALTVPRSCVAVTVVAASCIAAGAIEMFCSTVCPAPSTMPVIVFEPYPMRRASNVTLPAGTAVSENRPSTPDSVPMVVPTTWMPTSDMPLPC